jgi:hypothetical protein
MLTKHEAADRCQHRAAARATREGGPTAGLILPMRIAVPDGFWSPALLTAGAGFGQRKGMGAGAPGLLQPHNAADLRKCKLLPDN